MNELLSSNGRVDPAKKSLTEQTKLLRASAQTMRCLEHRQVAAELDDAADEIERLRDGINHVLVDLSWPEMRAALRDLLGGSPVETFGDCSVCGAGTGAGGVRIHRDGCPAVKTTSARTPQQVAREFDQLVRDGRVEVIMTAVDAPNDLRPMYRFPENGRAE